MTSPQNNNQPPSWSENYEYELPGEPITHSDKPLGQSLLSDPSTLPADVKPFDPEATFTLKAWRNWFIACAIVLGLGLTFEFGILGKNGKQGPLCQHLPHNKICYVLAGKAPKTSFSHQ